MRRVVITCDEGDEENPVTLALQKASDLFSSNVEITSNGISPLQSQTNDVVIIPWCSEKFLHNYLEKILNCGYGQEMNDTAIGKHRYIFISSEEKTACFGGLSSSFSHLRVAKDIKASMVIKNLCELSLDPDDAKPISSKSLRCAIEKVAFPSGAEEIYEILFRDKNLIHTFFRELRLKNPLDKRRPAVRMLLGAYASGDIDIDDDYFKKAVRKIATRILILDYKNGKINGKSLRKKIKRAKCRDWITEFALTPSRFKLDANVLCPLRNYFANRHILLIEDQLKEELWDLVLPLIFSGGIEGVLRRIVPDAKKKQILGDTTLTYARDCREALDEHERDLESFDLVLLDLYSSIRGHVTKGAKIKATIPSHVAEFINKIHQLYEKSTKKDNRRDGEQPDIVPKALPQVIVFSQESSGVSVRTMLTAMAVTDYFFKEAQGEPHKSAYYASFRNTVIRALKDAIIQVTELTNTNGRARLDAWLGQFDPCDRPLALQLMKHFRFYSPDSMIKTLSCYLADMANVDEEGKIQIFGSSRLKPSQFIFTYLGRPNKSGPVTLSLLSKARFMRKLKANPYCKNEDGSSELPKFRTRDAMIQELVECSQNWENDRMCLIIIDDVIQTGGQLQSYLWKFFNENLHKDISFVRPELAGDLYRRILEAFDLGCIPSEKQGIEVIVVFAVGIYNSYIKEVLRDIRIEHPKNELGTSDLGNLLKTKPSTTVSISGIINVSHPSTKEQQKESKDKQVDGNNKQIPNNNTSVILPIRVHIADFTRDAETWCAIDGISWKKVDEMLNKYTLITTVRKKEYPCDFEPFGWKKCKGLIATYANTPGNTLPIIWGDNTPTDGSREAWQPLFHRFYNPWHDGKTEQESINCLDAQVRLCKLTDVWTHEQHEQAWKRNKKGELYGVPLCKRRE